MKRFSILLLLLLLCITSCNARGSYETDSFDTTAPDTTAPEMTTEETTDEVTTGEEKEPTVTYLKGVEDPWYFDWQPHFGERDRYVSLLNSKQLTKADKRIAIQTPIKHEVISNGISARFDFFREHYRKGSLLQVRITLTNHRDTEVKMVDWVDGYSTYLENGWKLHSDEAWIPSASAYDGNMTFTLKPGESRSLERVISLVYLPSEVGNVYFVCRYSLSTVGNPEIPSERVEFVLDLPIVELPKDSPVLLDPAEIPWYLDSWEADPAYPTERRNITIAVKTPVSYEKEVDGRPQTPIRIHVDFFREYYAVDDPMQVRITITNTLDKPLHIEMKKDGLAWFTEKGGSKRRINTDYFPQENTLPYYTSSYYEETTAAYLDIPAGESRTVEYLFDVSEEFFYWEGFYLFHLKLTDHSVENGIEYWIHYEMEIPVEVVDVVYSQKKAS